MDTKNIRNFCIIAHIDHGKSTLADRLLEITGTVEKRKLKEQTMDQLDLEREKGITIKLKAVRMNYSFGKDNNQTYQLNLIDTPGHVDFSYEVSRSLAACEGAILVVDATQGIEAQTVSNVYKALEADLTIIPVINKIDVKGHQADEVEQDLINTFGFKREEILRVSAKTGENVETLLKELITKVPPPTPKEREKTLKALIFDTFYDDYLGVVAVVKITEGTLQKTKENEEIYFLASQKAATVQEIGIFTPQRKKTGTLKTGEVGYVATGLKDIHSIHVGDTLTYYNQKEDVQPLPGYKEIKPFVFVSIYPIENDDFKDLRKALEKLALSDAALTYEPESSGALGFGFRCGFLGLLHADVVQERLEREYNLELISTTPSVEYKVNLTGGETEFVKRPSEMPDRSRIESIEEPWILINIVSPAEYVGNIITLCEKRRGVQRSMEYPTENRVIFEYELPLSELIANFFDDLKSTSSGFASLDYEFLEYRQADVVKLDILVHGDVVEPLSHMVLRREAERKGRDVLLKLKEILPKQQFKVALQAAIGGRIVARENLPAMRKTVLQGIYGGHRERKDKLLERQKKGKERLKRIGSVDVPQEAFRKILSS
ncbi:elongation factor 4 [candidate division WWE3 bacterium]|nr:elongation factor 4 [candidate division WWE3 bacterium]